MAATLTLTPSLRRHLACPEAQVDGTSVREALESYFRLNPSLRGYVLDDQGALRKHVAIFVDGTLAGSAPFDTRRLGRRCLDERGCRRDLGADRGGLAQRLPAAGASR